MKKFSYSLLWLTVPDGGTVIKGTIKINWSSWFLLSLSLFGIQI